MIGPLLIWSMTKFFHFLLEVWYDWFISWKCDMIYSLLIESMTCLAHCSFKIRHDWLSAAYWKYSTIDSLLIRSVTWLVHFLLEVRHDCFSMAWLTSYQKCYTIVSLLIRNVIGSPLIRKVTWLVHFLLSVWFNYPKCGIIGSNFIQVWVTCMVHPL